jgi:hypothetical protein
LLQDERGARLRDEDVRRLRREVLKGLQLADVAGLADHLKALREERAKAKATAALRAQLADSSKPTTPEEVIAHEQRLRDYFAGLIGDSPSRCCISCNQLFFSSQTQAFAPRCLEQLRSNADKVRRSIASLRESMDEGNEVEVKENIKYLDTYFLAVAEIETAYADAQEKAKADPQLFGHPDKPSLRVCKRCWKALKAATSPRLGLWNSLKPEPLPPHLASLNELEAQLVSLRRPFMKIAALPRGGQKGVTGGVINVPADVEATMQRLLPLNLEDGRLVAVQLKRRLMYRTVERSQLVSPSRMVAALVELKGLNRHYVDVKIKEPAAWEKEVAEDSPLFADHFVQPADEPAPPASGDPPADEPSDAEDSEEEELELELGPGRKPLPVRTMVDAVLMPVAGPPIGDVNKIAAAQARQKRQVLAVAPSEGKRPLPLFLDPEVEELAFPTLFPSASNSARTERHMDLSLGEYLKNRITHSDRRFVSSKPFLFFSLFRLQYERLLRSINISLNKATMENQFGAKLNEVDYTSDDFVEQFIASDSGFRFMKQTRGSPQFWKTAQMDLVAMCRQLGPPTLFLTLSADDRHWEDVLAPMYLLEYKREPSAEDLENLSGRQRNHLLRKYPDVAARQFNSRVKTFFTKILGNDGVNPLGHKVLDYFYRYEYQQRGSPHVHCLLWLEGAPVLGKCDEEDFLAWADELVRTDLPDAEEDPELHELVSSKQVHRHTPACQKREKPRFKISAEEEAKMEPMELKRKKEDSFCRFDYQKEPLKESRLVHELPRKLREQEGEVEMGDSTLVGLLDDDEDMASVASGEGAERDGAAEEGQSGGARKSQASPQPSQDGDAAAKDRDLELEFQSASVKLEMRRKEGDGYVNNYHPAILRLWRANMDIQLVTNAFAAIQYITAYISKCEKELGEAMTEVLRSIPEGTSPIQRLRKIANAFMGTRSVSAQEAIHLILGLSLLMKSRQCQFLNSGFPQNRHRMLKPKKVRRKLEHPSVENIFFEGPMGKYERRDATSKEVAEMTFATFCAYYEGNDGRRGMRGDNEEEDHDGPGDDGDAMADERAAEEEEPLAPTDSNGNSLPKQLRLLRDDGEEDVVLPRRRRKKIIRYCNFSREDQKEEGAYSRLVLFRPFLKEAADMDLAKSGFASYKAWLSAEEEAMAPAVAEFDSYACILTESYDAMARQRKEQLEKAMAAADEDGQDDAGDDAEDPDDALDFFLDPADLRLDVLDGIGPDQDDGDVETGATEGPAVRKGFEGVSKEDLITELKEMEGKMNADQTRSFSVCCRHIEDYREAQKAGRRYRGRPIFISGPGGTGKSFILRALRIKIHLELHEDLEDLTSVVLAPTGCAAINVDGDTIHHALSLPIQQNFATVCGGLGAKKLQCLRNRYAEKTHAFLFDEVSMISSNQLYQINDRLRAINGVVEPDVFYGGFLTFWFGDLRQLNPVAAPRPYANASTKVVGAAAAGIHLWRDLMRLTELTIIERQKGDQAFAELLNRVRVGKHTDEDVEVLSSRLLSRPEMAASRDDPAVLDAIHLHPTNKAVDAHNDDRLKQLLQQRQAEAEAAGKDKDDETVHLVVYARDDFDKDSKLSRSRYEGDFQSLVPKQKDRTGGLPEQLHLIRGERVMLKKNLDVRDGLVNGSCGTVLHWSAGGKCVFVEFDRANGKLVGQEMRRKHKKIMLGSLGKIKAVVPIFKAEASFRAAKGKHMLRRVGFPLVAAWATTIHKAQGMSLERVVIDLSSKTLPAASAYVALSRVTSLAGLFLQGFCIGALKADASAAIEMDRLRKVRLALHKEVCQCPEDECWADLAIRGMGYVSTEGIDGPPQKCCGSTSHGKVRSPASRVSRALKKAVLPGEAKSRAAKKEGHVPARSRDLVEALKKETSLFVGTLVASQRKFSLAFFGTMKIPLLRTFLRENAVGLVKLLSFLRQAQQMPLECKARASHVDAGFERLLYTCLLKQLRPVSVPTDGNCLFHGLAVHFFGRSDKGHHRLFRTLTVAFVVLFKGHVKALIRADSPGVELSEEEVAEAYVKVCWDAFRLQSWGDKYSLYALSWVVGRPVHLYNSCYFWNRDTVAFDTTRPRGGARLDRDLEAVREEFEELGAQAAGRRGAGDSDLPSFVEYAAVDCPPNKLPVVLFLEQNHYVPLMIRRSAKRAQMIQPALRAWKSDLPAIRRQFPLVYEEEDVRAFAASSFHAH